MGAFFLDVAINFFIAGLIVFNYYEMIEKSVPEIFVDNIFLFSTLLLFFILFMLYSTILLGRFGATLGKMIFGLKVVDQDNNSISYKLAAKRTFLLLLIGGFWIFIASKESPHDKILNLRVVKRS